MIIWYFLHGSKNKQKMSNIVEGLLRDDEKWEWNLSEKTLVESLNQLFMAFSHLTTDMVF